MTTSGRSKVLMAILLVVTGGAINFAHAISSVSIPTTGIDGKWSGSIPVPNGSSTDVVFMFNVKGGKLEGSIFAIGKEFPLSEGKVKDHTIAFRIEGDTPFYTGNVSGDTINMKQIWKGGESGNRVFSFTLSRVKN